MLIPQRHIVQELQKENANAAHQNKLLESENDLLSSEVEQLRKASLLTTGKPRRLLMQIYRARRLWKTSQAVNSIMKKLVFPRILPNHPEMRYRYKKPCVRCGRGTRQVEPSFR
jgi:hypothetical protein